MGTKVQLFKENEAISFKFISFFRIIKQRRVNQQVQNYYIFL